MRIINSLVNSLNSSGCTEKSNIDRKATSREISHNSREKREVL